MIPDLAQWDVVRVRIRSTDKDSHPAVVISRADMCRDARVPAVNVLYGSTRRPSSSPALTDVVLNGADGLDRPTLVSCDHLHTVTKASIETRLGRVTYERRRALSRTLHRAFALLTWRAAAFMKKSPSKNSRCELTTAANLEARFEADRGVLDYFDPARAVLTAKRAGGLIETRELLADPKFMAALKKEKTGKGRYYPLSSIKA